MPPVQEKSEVSRHQYQDLGFDSAEPEKVNHLKPEELQTRMLLRRQTVNEHPAAQALLEQEPPPLGFRV